MKKRNIFSILMALLFTIALAAILVFSFIAVRDLSISYEALKNADSDIA